MGCACIDVYVDVYTKTISRGEQRARKSHQCDECSRTIEPGETYEKYAGKSDGDFFVHKTCSDCLSIRGEFFCGSWLWGDIIEELQQYIVDADGDISSECILALTPGARDMVFEMIEKYWEDDED